MSIHPDPPPPHEPPALDGARLARCHAVTILRRRGVVVEHDLWLKVGRNVNPLETEKDARHMAKMYLLALAEDITKEGSPRRL